MKKILLSVAVLMSAYIISEAQVSFGAKAGLNLYKFGGTDGSDLDFQKSKFSFHAGGFVNIPISSMFSVQPEVLYSGQGTKQEDNGDQMLWNLDYINVPLMLRYNNPVGFYAETGPEAGFLISAKVKVKAEGTDATEDIKDQMKGFNFSWGTGVGYITKSGFGIGARYNIGLVSIVDNSDVDVKNSGVQVSFIYRFSAPVLNRKK
ncbi:MAG: PorT family protein [Chitinophagaceae bacterium]|nr:PorT family protein [Chitinophagaceae bacterium]